METPPAREQDAPPNPRERPEDGAFVLRKLIADVPLSADGADSDIRITCVEVYDGNLYIGTSAAEILHFVLIPPEPNDPDALPTPILASRQQPSFINESQDGLQQILVLHQIGKACVLCNNTLTFYSLPELSPAFADKKPLPFSYIGGLDENVLEDETDAGGGVTILVGQKNRTRLIRITEELGPRSIKVVEYGGCQISRRRGEIACVADSQSYALLDVENQQKVPLFTISSLGEGAGGATSGTTQSIAADDGASRTAGSGSVTLSLHQPERGHGRSTSLGIFGNQRGLENPRSSSQARYGFDGPELFARSRSPWPAPSPERSPDRSAAPSGVASTADEAEKTLPAPPAEAQNAAPKSSEDEVESGSEPEAQPVPEPEPEPEVPDELPPHIVSPTPNEFLLVTGTAFKEPGVGMFVNLDGEPSRATIEFSSYPKSVVLDGQGIDPSASSGPGQVQEEGYVLAVVTQGEGSARDLAVEIQRWDVEPTGRQPHREWLRFLSSDAPRSESASDFTGLRTIAMHTDLQLPSIGRKLAYKRLDLRSLFRQRPTPTRGSSLEIDDEGAAAYAQRLSKWHARNVLWSHDQVWWVVRNPQIIRLDAQLDLATSTELSQVSSSKQTRSPIERLLAQIRGQQGWTEIDFLGLSYIRQKASILLFMNLIVCTMKGVIVFENDKRATEEALVEGEIDPRIILALLPVLRDEVIQRPNGISMVGGLQHTIETFIQRHDVSSMTCNSKGPFGDNLLQMIKRYLVLWRRKKGMASIADDKEVFQTVDAALLHVLLLLDQDSAKGPASAGSLRAELNGVVDGGVDCFDRAVALLEKYNRLYVLSRLYQSRKMTSKVLATWRRILEGEPDTGGELLNGEQEMRRYLPKLRDSALVEEYGAWLAGRNPKLGVQVFADDDSRVNFEPAHAVQVLKARAPAAVKEYLEHLVFGKKLPQYSNDLIGFYLDSVTDELSSSASTRTILLQTYETYRALEAPKPTYRQFITDNALAADWWTNRLRLLQLLGSSAGTEAANYDVEAILRRLKPYEQELVPEIIILAGRQGEHESAIRLLTHGLGDFDTAVNYCLLGGSSIFKPATGYIPEEAIPSRAQQAQLFKVLLSEFLKIEDLGQRIDRTSELLERFGGWFDIVDVLGQVPDEWAVEIFGGFLVSAMRNLVKDRNESEIAKALHGAVNMTSSVALAAQTSGAKPVIHKVE